MNPKTNSLFHFTKDIPSLQSILVNGFWPKYCVEDVCWLGYSIFDYIAYPMVSFCDIPLSRISEHVSSYGKFGIGMTKEWAIQNRLNPVLYVTSNSEISIAFRELNEHLNQLIDNDKITAGKISMRSLLAYSKPTEGNIIPGDPSSRKAFYQESEWRYIPKNSKIDDHIIKKNYDKAPLLYIENEKIKQLCSLTFTPKDVKYIFVEKEDDIPEIINYIQAEPSLGKYPSNDLKILMSRVISLEDIMNDF